MMTNKLGFTAQTWICFAVTFALMMKGNFGDKKPNVLLVIVDDLRPTVGCYSGDFYVTPNIDKLCNSSIRFNHAYVQQAVCAPSRTSFLTSRRPDTTRLYDFDSYWRKVAGNFTSLPQHFKEHGYHTVSVGKVFHPGIASNHCDDQPYSWSQLPYHPSTQKYKQAKVCYGPGGYKYRNIVCPINVEDQPEGTLPDIQSAEFSVEFLKNHSQDRRKPFFLAVGFHKPHIPLKYPRQFTELYPLDSIDLAPNRWYPPNLPLVAWNPWTDLRRRDDVMALNVSFPFGPLPDHYQRLVRQSYYASTSYIDNQIGLVLTALRTYGFADNTIILLTGDHGWSLGEHQEWSKFSNFDVALRVPLILHVPHKTLATSNHRKVETTMVSNAQQYGVSTDAIVELVDIFPTLSELAGIPVPQQCPVNSSAVILCTEGQSFVPLLFELYKHRCNVPWKKAAFSQYPRPSFYPTNDSDLVKFKKMKIMGYTMRTHRYRYTEWVGFDHKLFLVDWSKVYAKELYVYECDSGENDNQAYNESFRYVVKELSYLLHEGWRKVKPEI